ncbi:thrombospondin type 3 repeat-containing protein [Patescibacteria group bacterium]|nr:thrombospondin type 3 repeat-containing protein [Patescibacteria group bacterium]
MKQDENSIKKSNDDFLVPEINPLDEIKNDIPISKHIDRSVDDLTENKKFFSSLKSDKEDIKRKILDSRDDVVWHISNNIDVEAKNNEELNMPFSQKNSSKKTNNKKSINRIILILFIFLVVLISGVCYYVLNADKNLSESAEIVFHQQNIVSAFEAMKNLETYSFTVKIESKLSSIESKEAINSVMLMKLAASGKVDNANKNYPKAAYNFEIDSESEIKLEKTSFFLDLGIMSFGKSEEAEIYINLKDINSELLELIPGIQLDSLKNKWYGLRMNDFKDMSIISPELLDFINSTEKNKFDIKSINEKYSYIKFKSDLGDEKIGDINTYHYLVEVDSNALIDFYIELMKENLLMQEEGFLGGLIKSFDGEIARFEENPEYREIIEDFAKQIETELWIGKSDNFVYKIHIHLEMDEDFIKDIEKRTEEIKDDFDDISLDFRKKIIFFNVNVELNLSEFNQQVIIEKPKNYENLLIFLMESFRNNLLISVDSDNDGLTDDMESIYGTDVNNPDSDGDGFSDGDEVNNGYDPLIPGEARLKFQ